MLVLAVDTSTPAVTAGVVSLTESAVGAVATTLATRVRVDARSHAEILTPNILECLSEAQITAADLGAVVVGVGPGPYTGLRVGMATAAAFGDALGLPVFGVCSLDAIASDVSEPGSLLVVTDARRREIYWARYEAGVRIAGPDVVAPADLDRVGVDSVAGSAPHAAAFELPIRDVQAPSPAGLVAVAAADIGSGMVPGPLVPLYLRRPDAKTLDERAAAKALK
ncbi:MULTISPECIES: tRNA (adenosine(37)-N6)-threonylcarbamoyltransferase complex dimerization subunit type 1 TsaB [unclassified Rhodococcus (in: high G+C Gram-positive bacteria)]|uniref:tRNA (adenosine(37)-N6)-threonylcarbamoyltransferase complex dimerization subunit type 1 TsaB n=1 Tax=unclassified Rhodococcus (in: high G+C Gram-positive bacteria) TaxID=192944 RepID=UPI0011EE77D9|nr:MULTISPECIES: tRNA (adenosine(37)-N6)-threonylcarbamoyltransferase complex dimerization subunit type 1 TsaB [unclassified Rhodococcus (in: high G+C Gram-positive bacteria)]KAA0928152.1 tRNA (adenosine(37)-N6)-threonylcarbamoyltransferase complex dimerization subunit type 1 TsaB [Rhodococcus sp. ANT_H53B]MDI9925337.1 tRNA (adenosine(37)-N6)-threonylcarbamoyltransferase complex dimerization subunit type 1 TsaB [Rhodococcus sp. IEGM 1341]